MGCVFCKPEDRTSLQKYFSNNVTITINLEHIQVVATIKILSFGIVNTSMNVCCVNENYFSCYSTFNIVECMAHLCSRFRVFISESTELEITKKSSQVQLSTKLPCVMILLFLISGGLDSTPSHSNGAGGS
jgi:hypothetical protein